MIELFSTQVIPREAGEAAWKFLPAGLALERLRLKSSGLTGSSWEEPLCLLGRFGSQSFSSLLVLLVWDGFFLIYLCLFVWSGMKFGLLFELN